MDKYNGKEITVEGDTSGPPVTIEGYFQPLPSLHIITVVNVSPPNEPHLSVSFTDIASWHTERNEKYGIQLAYPATMTSTTGRSPAFNSNFVRNENVETVAMLAIPEEAYAGANLLSGLFGVFVNPDITNTGSCAQFGVRAPEETSNSSTLTGGIRYSRMEGDGAATGTWYDDFHFHTFQNGLCYEIAFELVEYNAHNSDAACNVPLLTHEDNVKLVEPLLANISFFRPDFSPAKESGAAVVPQVTEFTASDGVADGRINRGQVTLSWNTRDADYVELTYTCREPDEVDQGGVFSLVISEDGPNRYCRNTPSFKTYSTDHFYHSPNASATLGFGYFNHDDPTSLVVTITPFSHGVGYPDSAKSLSITVRPYNPFSRGVPTDTRNMTVAYAPSAAGTQSYEQGSPLTVSWTDTRTQDPCVNLYLVQDDGRGGENYLLQINGKPDVGCLKPSSRGSYAWTVTNKFSGSGFRVLARTPGGFSGALGAAFEILKPAAR